MTEPDQTDDRTLRRWGEQLDELARQIDQKADAAKLDAKDRWTDLKARTEKMKHQLEAIGDDAGERWDRVKRDLGDLTRDIERAFAGS